MPASPKALYLLLALLGLIAAAVLVLVAIAALALGGGSAAVAPAAALCSATAFFPGIAFAWIYLQANRRDRGLAQVGALMEGYGEVTAATMASKLGTTEERAEQLMAMSIREGHARGRIDPETRTFRKTEGG